MFSREPGQILCKLNSAVSVEAQRKGATSNKSSRNILSEGSLGQIGRSPVGLKATPLVIEPVGRNKNYVREYKILCGLAVLAQPSLFHSALIQFLATNKLAGTENNGNQPKSLAKQPLMMRNGVAINQMTQQNRSHRDPVLRTTGQTYPDPRPRACREHAAKQFDNNSPLHTLPPREASSSSLPVQDLKFSREETRKDDRELTASIVLVDRTCYEITYDEGAMFIDLLDIMVERLGLQGRYDFALFPPDLEQLDTGIPFSENSLVVDATGRRERVKFLFKKKFFRLENHQTNNDSEYLRLCYLQSKLMYQNRIYRVHHDDDIFLRLLISLASNNNAEELYDLLGQFQHLAFNSDHSDANQLRDFAIGVLQLFVQRGERSRETAMKWFLSQMDFLAFGNSVRVPNVEMVWSGRFSLPSVTSLLVNKFGLHFFSANHYVRSIQSFNLQPPFNRVGSTLKLKMTCDLSYLDVEIKLGEYLEYVTQMITACTI